MRCINAARARHEPLAGTAPVARRWLMIEVNRAWASDPLDSEQIAGPMADRLRAAEKELNAVVVLVRRPGREAPRPVARWWAVDTLTGRQVDGEWRHVDDLAAAVEGLSVGVSRSQSPAELTLLVCTHGTRDMCCAVEGRPIARALSKEWPEAVWECTHLGGHRFAPTFAILPDGVLHGRVTHGNVVAVVRDHLAGRVAAATLRGLSRLSPAEQTAQAWAFATRGPLGLPDVTVLSAEPTQERCTRVVLEVAGELGEAVSYAVEVTATPVPPTELSCLPAKPKPSTTYAVTAAHVVA